MAQEQQLFSLSYVEPKIFVLSGLSGSGKDSVLKELKKRNLAIYYVITATTREMRPGEVQGVDYYFVSIPEFEEMIARDELIEYAVVYEQYKGIPKAQITQALSSNQDVVVRVDVQGAAKIKSLFPNAILIFLIPASEDEWRMRLLNREGDSQEQLKVRSETAKNELSRLKEFDYLVVNPQDKLSDAVDDIVAIIDAEKHRISKG